MEQTSFLQLEKPQRLIPGKGPKDAKIVIIGEAGGAYEDARLEPFVGPAGNVLEQCLHSAGLLRSEVYLTNVVKIKPKGNVIDPYFNTTKGIFTALGMEWVVKLREELNEMEPNVIVTCGATSMAALIGRAKVTKLRGYVFESINLNRVVKVIPTIHPAAALRGVYLYRHLIAADLKKAKTESKFPDLKRPDRQLIYDFTTAGEVMEWLDYFRQQPVLCFDTEVLNYELACISFSSTPDIAVSIPLAGRWSLEDECIIFRGIQSVLGNPNSIKVAQNAIFDTHFLLTKCGIEVRGEIHDTMVGHSVMFPELQKGLAFLGSIYCGSQAYWKDLAKFTNIKEES